MYIMDTWYAANLFQKEEWVFRLQRTGFILKQVRYYHPMILPITYRIILATLQDGNGFINRQELRFVMMNLGENMEEEVIFFSGKIPLFGCTFESKIVGIMCEGHMA